VILWNINFIAKGYTAFDYLYDQETSNLEEMLLLFGERKHAQEVE
jgi:hypothetical protein